MGLRGGVLSVAGSGIWWFGVASRVVGDRLGVAALLLVNDGVACLADALDSLGVSSRTVDERLTAAAARCGFYICLFVGRFGLVAVVCCRSVGLGWWF